MLVRFFCQKPKCWLFSIRVRQLSVAASETDLSKPDTASRSPTIRRALGSDRVYREFPLFVNGQGEKHTKYFPNLSCLAISSFVRSNPVRLKSWLGKAYRATNSLDPTQVRVSLLTVWNVFHKSRSPGWSPLHTLSEDWLEWLRTGAWGGALRGAPHNRSRCDF